MTGQPLRILAAVDFGEAAMRAVALAGVLARRCGASLRLLHAEALEAPPYFTRAELEAIEGQARANRRRAEHYLREFGRRHTDHPFEAVVDSRAAADAILHAATGAGLIVMGTHGRRGPGRWWLGSVAERVLRETETPLLVVHARPVPEASAAFAAAMVLGSEESEGTRTRQLTAAIAGCVAGSVIEVQADDVRRARASLDATWVAVPAPTPRTGRWLSHVGEPLITGCMMPVLFVPEARGGPTP